MQDISWVWSSECCRHEHCGQPPTQLESSSYTQQSAYNSWFSLKPTKLPIREGPQKSQVLRIIHTQDKDMCWCWWVVTWGGAAASVGVLPTTDRWEWISTSKHTSAICWGQQAISTTHKALIVPQADKSKYADTTKGKQPTFDIFKGADANKNFNIVSHSNN